jgi:hypothetical protein
MSTTHSATLRSTFAQDVANFVDGGTSNGKLVIMDSSDNVLATINLQSPAFSRSGAVLTLIGVPLAVSATAAGIAAKFKFTNSSDAISHEGSCGTSDADMILDNTNIASGQTVRISSYTYTAAL